MESNSFTYKEFNIIINYNKNSGIINIDIINESNDKIYNTSLKEENLTIKPMQKFYKILTKAIGQEKNYFISIDSIESGTKLKLDVKFTYDELVDLSDSILLINQENSHNILESKIKELEEKYKKDFEDLKESVTRLMRSNNNVLNVLKDKIEEVKKAKQPNDMITIYQKYDIETRQIFNLKFDKNSEEIDLLEHDCYINPSTWIHFPKLSTLKVKNINCIFVFDSKYNQYNKLFFPKMNNLILASHEGINNEFKTEDFPIIMQLTVLQIFETCDEMSRLCDFILKTDIQHVIIKCKPESDKDTKNFMKYIKTIKKFHEPNGGVIEYEFVD